MFRQYLLVFFVALVAVLLPAAGGAYECKYPISADEEFKNADAVFTGKVHDIISRDAIAKSDGGTGFSAKTITFQLDRVWKGISDKNITVDVVVEDFYGYDFVKGEAYFMHAYRIYNPEKTLSVIGCPRIRKMADAKDDIARLGFAKVYLGDLQSDDDKSDAGGVHPSYDKEFAEEVIQKSLEKVKSSDGVAENSVDEAAAVDGINSAEDVVPVSKPVPVNAIAVDKEEAPIKNPIKNGEAL